MVLAYPGLDENCLRSPLALTWFLVRSNENVMRVMANSFKDSITSTLAVVQEVDFILTAALFSRPSCGEMFLTVKHSISTFCRKPCGGMLGSSMEL